jgi:RimJ/RimL family protein N-acetyltransferase
MNRYTALNKQIYTLGDYSIVPIRQEDRYDIMRWRNEQIYHLRQEKLLTREDQDKYFKGIVLKSFTEKQPGQILFSYLNKNKCIGYGGLVHINWVDRNAEISFLIETSFGKDLFEFHWTNFIQMIERVATDGLHLHKIFTYAYDVRPHIYEILEKNSFIKEAVLKEHCFTGDKFIDVIIHSRILRDH